MIAVIELGFDPLLRLGDLTIRWQTIGVTIALLAALGLAAAVVESSRTLRFNEMVLILVGVVPGAVVGGRLIHVVSYLDAYLASPLSIVDPRVGTLSLLGAVLGGTAGALYVIRLLGAPATRWADLAAMPLILALGLGKVAQLLGGSGQGLPFDGPWALAFLGDGPWVSASPQIPAHPAQLYEGLWLLVGLPILGALWRTRSELRRPGALFIGALCWFLAGRVLVGFTWRDPGIIGPLNAEQLLALITLAGTLGLAFRRIVGPTHTDPTPPTTREP